MRVSEKMFLTARFARGAESAERKYLFFSADRRFSLCGRGQKRNVYRMVAIQGNSRHTKLKSEQDGCAAERLVVICFPSSQRKTN
jgi:hypothetical protein